MNNAPAETSPKSTYRLMAIMALALMALIGMAIYSLSQMSSGTWTSALKDPVLNPTVQQNVPQFKINGEGKSLTTDNFEGHWTLLTFWAYWCEPCLEEMPALNSLGQQWQGPEFELMTVNIDQPGTESYESARRYLTENSIMLPTMFDKTGELKKVFSVNELPQHFLINPKKQIVWQARGAFKWNEASARDQLQKIMEQSSEATAPPDQEPPSESAE